MSLLFNNSVWKLAIFSQQFFPPLSPPYFPTRYGTFFSPLPQFTYGLGDPIICYLRLHFTLLLFLPLLFPFLLYFQFDFLIDLCICVLFQIGIVSIKYFNLFLFFLVQLAELLYYIFAFIVH